MLISLYHSARLQNPKTAYGSGGNPFKLQFSGMHAIAGWYVVLESSACPTDASMATQTVQCCVQGNARSARGRFAVEEVGLLAGARAVYHCQIGSHTLAMWLPVVV